MSESQVRGLEEQRCAAMLAADLATLDGLLDDGLTYTHSNHAYPHSSGAIVRYPWLNKELGHEASDAGRSVA